MKKKLIIAIISAVVVAGSTVGVVVATKHEHNYIQTVTAPTCTERGFTTYTCECGESYIDNYVSATGHSFTNYLSDNNATETQDGTKTALCNNPGCNEKDTVIDVGSVLGQSYLSFNSLTVQGNNVYGTVSNATEVFEFENEITAGKTCEYVVSLDEFGTQTSLTKTVPLAIGDNTFYIFESVDGAPKNTFIVTIRRKPVYTVTFNSNCGTPIQSQTVEEGYLASTPTEQITKIGYTFTGWDFDFTAPITKSITIDVKFEVKPEMANFNFTSNFSTCEITGLKDNTVTQVIIPDYVTSIGDDAFLNCDSLTSVEIGDSVTSIGSLAFANCDSLTSVEIGDSVTSIGGGAFYDCYKLVEVINKSSHITVTKGSTSNGYVGYYALSVSIRDNAYVSKITNDNGYIIYTNGAEKVLVGYTGKETALTLPSYVTTINQYAFRSCDSLASVVIGDSVTSIGNYAFVDCYSLTSIEIPNSVTSIGSYAFANCYSLTSVEIGDSVTSIGSFAFHCCDSLTSLEIGDSVTSIGFYAFYMCDSLTSVVIGDSVTSIGSFAFAYCYSLTSVVIGDSVTSIGSSAFEYCKSLTSVVIGDSVTSIGDSAFEDCKSLTSVVIGDSVTSISVFAFEDCKSLTSVVIGDSVTSISERAFAGCCKLVEVINKSSHITVTKGSSSNGCVGYYALSVSNCDNTYVSKLTKDNGYIIYTEGVEKILVGYTGAETALTLPSYVTKIYKDAFYNCDSLTSVVIGDSVTSIGSSAFWSCDSLTSVVIPNSVTSIGSSAFYNCDSLTSVVIGDSVTSIGDDAFSSCSSLTSVVIPDSVTSIGSYAFYSCSSLTSVVIGDSVTSIGSYAFYYCDSLASVVIGDSVTSIGSFAFYMCDSITSVEIGDSVTSIGGSAFV